MCYGQGDPHSCSRTVSPDSSKGSNGPDYAQTCPPRKSIDAWNTTISKTTRRTSHSWRYSSRSTRYLSCIAPVPPADIFTANRTSLRGQETRDALTAEQMTTGTLQLRRLEEHLLLYHRTEELRWRRIIRRRMFQEIIAVWLRSTANYHQYFCSTPRLRHTQVRPRQLRPILSSREDVGTPTLNAKPFMG